MPQPPTDPLDARIRDAVALNQTEGHAINQKQFVARARVQLALYFERLPGCLRAFPFVDPTHVPPFPHHPERGIRPTGTFFDIFGDTDEEQVQ